MIPVKISAKSARLRFNGCEPDYIRTVCHARCCDAPTRPTGTFITIHPTEQPRIEALGATVTDGLLQPRPGCRACPFKTEDFLCGLHGGDAKPFGCIASPFTLNANDTLIVRNRYKLLPCYDDGRQLPAYRAFSSSLVLLFGRETAATIVAHLDAGGDDLVLPMRPAIYRMLKDNDAIKHAAHGTGVAG